MIQAKVTSGAGLEVSVYATLAQDQSIAVAIINRDQAQDVAVQLDATHYFSEGKILRLEAQALDATTGVTFGGTSVAADGSWQPVSNETVLRGTLFLDSRSRRQCGGDEAPVSAAARHLRAGASRAIAAARAIASYVGHLTRYPSAPSDSASWVSRTSFEPDSMITDTSARRS